ncbi:MAG: thiamine phosphate synthase, partial [Micromonosporaceae bacterium]
PAPGPAIVGRSCHDAAEVDSAVTEGLDYVTVSPVFATASKPGYGPALGVDALRAVCHRFPMPVYALGGVTAANAGDCVAAGSAGVAVMGGVMRAEDPATATAELLAALSDAEGALADSEGRAGRWSGGAGAGSAEQLARDGSACEDTSGGTPR